MAQFKEFEGKNVDAAVQAACKALKISTDKLKYDVISYGSSGIFGLVQTKKAKIRVAMAKIKKAGAAPPPKVADGSETTAPMAKTETPPAGEADDSPEPPVEKTVSSPAAATEPEMTIPEAETPFAGDGGVPPESSKAQPDEPPAGPLPAAPVATDNGDAIALGREVLGKILDAITEEARISVDADGERILFNVEGGNSAILIGKRGQTLEAIQYLVEKAVNKIKEERLRVQVDVKGYLKNRRNNLRSTAEKLAAKSKRTGKPITLGQMSAYDRRIVHLALKGDGGVRTQSQGGGFYRKLVIFPKRGPGQKGRDRDPDRAGSDLPES